jgi:hypothetical protein
MRSFFAFLAVNIFFIAANALFAGAIWLAFTVSKHIMPAAMDEPLLVFIIGTLVLIWCIWLISVAVKRFTGVSR